MTAGTPLQISNAPVLRVYVYCYKDADWHTKACFNKLLIEKEVFGSFLNV